MFTVDSLLVFRKSRIILCSKINWEMVPWKWKQIFWLLEKDMFFTNPQQKEQIDNKVYISLLYNWQESETNNLKSLSILVKSNPEHKIITDNQISGVAYAHLKSVSSSSLLPASGPQRGHVNTSLQDKTNINEPPIWPHS